MSEPYLALGTNPLCAFGSVLFRAMLDFATNLSKD